MWNVSELDDTTGVLYWDCGAYLLFIRERHEMQCM